MGEPSKENSVQGESRAGFEDSPKNPTRLSL